jgi:catechol 2,3-dioxygenase-like lactoylglutathione lyase family enzyme
MKFKSNDCIAVHVKDLAKAEAFYSGVMGFKLKSKTKNYLEFNTGHFLFYVNKSAKKQAPIPSFNVKNVGKAKRLLAKAGCKVVVDRGDSIYFKDPFGFIYDVVQR